MAASGESYADYDKPRAICPMEILSVCWWRLFDKNINEKIPRQSHKDSKKEKSESQSLI